MTYRMGIDVGGTFTDVLLIDDSSGRMMPIKTPSTPHDQSEGVLNGIFEACKLAGINVSELEQILHGTTVATNAALEGDGARVGLLVTKGFEKTLHLARSWTPGPLFGWMIYEKPDPLAPLDLTVGVAERIDSHGDVVVPLNTDDVVRQIRSLVERGAESLTVCLVNSYVNSSHEKMVKDIARVLYPELPISVSSEILSEFKEYERTLTTVMNSYVKPKMQRYLANFEKRIKDAGMESRLSIVRSDGGLMSVQAAADQPVHTMLSGPSGGVAAAAFIGRLSGHRNLITFDMGGTSTDVATIIGQPSITRSTQVGFFPVKAPAVDVVSIGAGGGSIAHVPAITGALRVGPQSAGALPGPACYGRGGTEPTVSDANIVLGRLPVELLDGGMHLDLEAAKRAVQSIADHLGKDLYEAAQGIIDIVNENMFGAIRVVSVERGYDPRDFALIGFGGAGPLHANALGRLSGAFPVIIPPEPGVLSALGFNVSNHKNEFSKTFISTLDATTPADIIGELRTLGDDAMNWLESEGVPEADRTIEYQVDLRYYRQGFELPMQVSLSDLEANGFDTIANEFHEAHERLYNFRMSVALELVNMRAIGVGRVEEPAVRQLEFGDGNASRAIAKTQEVYFDGEFMSTPIYRRSLLQPGDKIDGPAIVTQYDTTTVVLPEHIASVDEYLNIVIQPRG
ncbi:hydantoinase/oxoprolinase family protein [Alicyclobacillus sp. ALC3]|uniref:hydantoinase/oxoprolinase family protein n=1 Tax=Alicyclobacillus sp. ALC3 TaxID=2796143 RepID=UPI0023780DD9|nr:hydantoinase/oxoprolinase family protein [Alicyclobacillus sp. ALC3]WDL97699.1 hydantoinase/oxoprolinase family protein [Alicyclobacillus sp. ALC3]